MEVQITTRHVKTSPGLHETITEKIGHIQRFYERITSCHVVLDSEHTDQTAEIVMTVRGHTLTVKAKSDSIGKSFEMALNKLEAQLKKTSERVKEHRAARPEKAE
jgi:putative sigma-54 modulation protein